MPLPRPKYEASHPFVDNGYKNPYCHNSPYPKDNDESVSFLEPLPYPVRLLFTSTIATLRGYGLTETLVNYYTRCLANGELPDGFTDLNQLNRSIDQTIRNRWQK